MLYDAAAVLTRRWCRVLLVFFRMDEIVTVSHRVSVLGDSRHVETVATDRTGECELVRRMQGRAQGEVYPGEDPAQGAVTLSARGLTGGVVVGLDLKLRSSEILGVTGLVGMDMTSWDGHDKLPYLLYGELPNARRVAAIQQAVCRPGPPRGDAPARPRLCPPKGSAPQERCRRQSRRT